MSCMVDYRCEECEEVTEYDKGSMLNDAPKNIKCSKCGSKKTYRIFGCQAYEVCEGLQGNARTGYSKGVTYHSSQFTPKRKGTKVR